MTAALTTHATQRRDRYQTLKQDTQSDFNTAKATQASAKSDYDSAVAAAAEVDKNIASLRKQLSTSSNMPADIADLGEDLRDRLIERAHLTAAIARTRQAHFNAKTQAELLQARLTTLSSQLKDAEADLAKAELREAQHTAWTDAGLEDRIDTLRTIAGQLLDGSFTPDSDADSNPLDTLNDARNRVEGEIPQVLRNRARARAGQADARIQAYRDLRDAIADHYRSHRATAEGDSGRVAQREAEFESAENGLKRYALNIIQNYTHALELLQSAVDSAPLSHAASEAIVAAALAADSDEVATETTLHDARRAVEDKELEVELATVAALVNDFNANSDDDPDVQARRSELTALQSDLADAKAAHTEAFATAMDLWEAAVPDAIWNNLHRYDQAVDMLTELRDSDPSPLVTALTDTENALITTLAQDDNNRRLRDYLSDSLSLAREESDFLARFSGALSISALRGDY